MFYVHLNGDDVYMSKSEEPRGTVVVECPDYQVALNRLLLYRTYVEPDEPMEQYVYEEDDSAWFA